MPTVHGAVASRGFLQLYNNNYYYYINLQQIEKCGIIYPWNPPYLPFFFFFLPLPTKAEKVQELLI